MVGCTYRGMPQTIAQVRNLIGANISFRREVFEVVGGFQNGIGRIGKRPLGCEETELCIRTRQRWPWSIFLYEPAAKVYHRVPASRARWDYFRARCYAEGLSKALLSRLVGKGDALSSERNYTFKTLPKGIARNIAVSLNQREPAGLSRAAAILAGLTITTAGFISGNVIQQIGRQAMPSNNGDSSATTRQSQPARSLPATTTQERGDTRP